MSAFTFIDLFAGIGGFHAALSDLGGSCVYAAEHDDDARAVYEAAWLRDHEDVVFARDINDDVPPLDDIATIAELKARVESGAVAGIRNIPDFDVLAAGFPCQAFSKSGHQHGVLDEIRGTLFYNILRIVAERRPKVVFLENVRNLVGPRHRDSTFRTIIGALRDLKYLVSDQPTIMSPHRIPGEMGGGPQVRERVYILALRADLAAEATPFPGFVFPDWNTSSWRIDESPLRDGAPAVITDRWLGDQTDPSLVARLRDLRGSDSRELTVGDAAWVNPWRALIEAAVSIGLREGRLKPGVPVFPGHPIWLRVADRRWRIKQEEDALTLGQHWKTEFVTKSVQFLEDHSEALRESGALDRILSFRHNSWMKLEWQAGDARTLDDCLIQLRPSGIRVKKASYAPALVAINQTPILGSEMRRLSPYETGRLQGFPDRVFRAMESLRSQGRRTPESWDRAFYKQFGNAIHVGAVQFALAQLMAHHFPAGASSDDALSALLDACRERQFPWFPSSTETTWPPPNRRRNAAADRTTPWVQDELAG